MSGTEGDAVLQNLNNLNTTLKESLQCSHSSQIVLAGIKCLIFEKETKRNKEGIRGIPFILARVYILTTFYTLVGIPFIPSHNSSHPHVSNT